MELAKPTAAVVVQGMRMIERGGVQPYAVDSIHVPGESGGQGEQMAAESPADELWNQSELDDLDVVVGMDLQLHQPDDF